MRTDRSGFTLIEVLVAVVMLGLGVVALASSSAMATRMIGRGKMETRAAQMAGRRLELLRLTAYSTTPRCTALADGGPQTADNVTESWTITGAGPTRTLTVAVSHATVSGVHNDTLQSMVEC